MFYGACKQTARPGRRERDPVCLGPAAGKDQTRTARQAQAIADAIAGLFDTLTRPSTGSMDRRWIATTAQDLRHCGDDTRPHRGRRVMIEIDKWRGHWIFLLSFMLARPAYRPVTHQPLRFAETLCYARAINSYDPIRTRFEKPPRNA
jgi:hypothetical protein